MVKTTYAAPGYDLASAGAVRSTFRRLLPETAVGAILVVVVDIRGEQPLQMRFVDGNHLIQQFEPAAADPALGHPILPRTTDGSPHGRMFMERIASGTSLPYLASWSRRRNLVVGS